MYIDEEDRRRHKREREKKGNTQGKKGGVTASMQRV
jgi:hypothetical protein